MPRQPGAKYLRCRLDSAKEGAYRFGLVKALGRLLAFPTPSPRARGAATTAEKVALRLPLLPSQYPLPYPYDASVKSFSLGFATSSCFFLPALMFHGISTPQFRLHYPPLFLA